jgi:hypothetical protein
MKINKSIRRHYFPSVQHYLIRFDLETGKFYHRKTGEEIMVPPSDFDENQAGWFLLTSTILLMDGTTVDSNLINCDINTGACFNRTTNQPIQLQPNQVHLVVIEHQNSYNDDSVLKVIQKQLTTHRGKSVRIKEFRKDYWNGPFYCVEYESHQIQ